MAKVDVLNLNGDKVGSIELADAVFAPDQVNEALLWEAVKHYRAAQRQGTHKTKSRTEVAGSGKKLWKQKGTGRARIGSVRSPLWRHGYTVHGPQPRSYDYAFPRKKLLGALRAALASKLADGTLTFDGYADGTAAGISTQMNTILGTSTVWTYMGAQDAVGTPGLAANAIENDVEITSDVGAVVTIKGTAQVTGAVTVTSL